MAKSFGQVTIRDLNDVGRITSQISANQPAYVIYDPNAVTQYVPDWSTSNLVLTPIIHFNATELEPTAQGLTIEWKRKVGSGDESALITGESVSGGVLTVRNNMLKDITSGLITYVCHITYRDPESGMDVVTMSTHSFALIRNATELKDCSIVGENTFLYNSEGQLTSPSSITLTAQLSNVSISQWQYKSTSGYVKYPNSTASSTLTVNDQDAVFINDVATIKLVTSDTNVYSIVQIVKLRDGAAGTNSITCALSNDSQSIPCDSNGNLYGSSLNGCSTKITIYEGGNDITGNWTIVATPSTGVAGTYDEETFTYTVTGMTVDAGYVEFTATQSGYANVVKRFSIMKERSGADGQDAVIYDVKASTAAIKLNKDNVFIPSGVTFKSYKTVGNGSASLISSRFKIYESTDGSTYTLKYASSSNENSKTFNPTSTNVRTIKCEMYESGGTTKLLDEQTVPVINDGADGQKGDAGNDSTTMFLGNYSENIPCNSDGTVKAAKDITISFYGYKGTARAAVTCSVPTLPNGMSVKTNTSGTTSAGGTLVLTVASGATIASANSGDITLTLTCNGTSSEHKFTWIKNIQAQDGVYFQIFAPNGDIISNSSNNVTLQSQLTSGTTIVNSGVTYQWAKLVGNTYTNVSQATSASLTVTPEMVDSYASFRCTATYGGVNYIAYYSVRDVQDPLQVYEYCTLGTDWTNGELNKAGALYILAYVRDEEVDPIKTTYFSETAPSNPVKGDYYYKLDRANKTVTLMKYSGSSWTAAVSSDQPTGTYEWYRRNSDGTMLDTTTPWKTGKVIYIDSTMVDKKLVIDYSVEI